MENKNKKNKYDTQYLSMEMVCKITGLNAQTLRNYHKQNILVPAVRKSQNNIRYYTGQQIRNLILSKYNVKLKKELLKVSKILNVLIYQLNETNDNKNSQQNN